jgi:putative transferase (TIGR04331 family)
MNKLIFAKEDLKEPTDEYLVIDKWYEKLLGDISSSKEKIKYLNDYIFSIEDEKKSVEEVDKIYEQLLKELSVQLNEIHKINWSLKSWRIFIGPWLNRFIAIIYDRSDVLLPILGSEDIDCKKQLDVGCKISLSSYSMRDFTDKILKKDWNDKLFCRIIYLIKTNNFDNHHNLVNSHNHKFEDLKTKIDFFFKIILFSILRLLFYPITKFNKFVFYKPYFGNLKNLIKFILKLRDIPFKYSFSFFDNFILKKNFNIKIRNKLNIQKNSENIKEKITRHLIKECIPTIYLEGFNSLKNISKKTFLPNSVKTIITFNAWRDNIFKFWLADQSNNGAKIIYGQHGAGYGTNLKHYAELHEFKICDKYLTWGWKKNGDKTLPIGDVSSFQKKNLRYINNGKILIVAGNINIFKFNNIIHDKEDLIKKEIQMNTFLLNLEKGIIKNLDLKEHPNDRRRDFSIKKIINNKNIKIINLGNNFEKILKNYELLVFPYQFATPFLKFLSLNKPCLSFFDDDFLEEEVKQDFIPLYKVNILHNSPEKMALFLNKNYGNLQSWWAHSETQNAREKFCDKYSNKNVNFSLLIQELKKSQKILYK